jgi:hypothetical protein
MTKDEISSIEIGDVIYQPYYDEWWKVIGSVRKHNFLRWTFGKKTGFRMKCEEGFMQKFSPTYYRFEVQFYKHGILVKNDTPQKRLFVKLKHGQ